MLGGDTFIDKIMQKIMNGLLAILEIIVSLIFFNRLTMVIFWLVAVNLLAIIMMKKDKQYAREEKRRIRESTLLIIAFAGGAIGMYYAMYKYKHKTLHKKFTICVPFFINLAYLSPSSII